MELSPLVRALFIVVFVAVLVAWATPLPPAVEGFLWLVSAVVAALNAIIDRREGDKLGVALWVIYAVMAVICSLIGLGVLERPHLPKFPRDLNVFQ